MYDDSETIGLETVALNSGVLVKLLVVGIDPYLISRMRDAGIPGYAFSKNDL